MATTVNSAFSEFNTYFVNLDTVKTKKALSSRDWLWGQLNKFDDKDNSDFPFRYEDKHIKFGSFARKTKIRELDDIDLMFCLSGDGATYYYKNYTYYIDTSYAGNRLKKLSNDDDTLNSTRVLNLLKRELYNVEHYKLANLHRRGEAATLELKSYEWNFDIVPCFYAIEGFYLIPDGKGNWKATNPKIDQDLVTDTNQKYGGKLLQLIRTLKYWNREVLNNLIGSYLFEQIVIKFACAKGIKGDIEKDLRNFFLYLKEEIYKPIYDPKEFQGDLNNLSYLQKNRISEEAEWAYNKAREAINSYSEEEAIEKWQEIFGNNFPEYE